MNEPVTEIYLDSSDYSNMSGDPRFKDHLLAIESAKNSGRIAIRCSATLVCEVSPTKPDALEFGVARLRLMHRLCGSKAIRFAGDLMHEELTGRRGDSLTALSDRSGWAPTFAFDAELQQMKDELLGPIRQYPRNQRRTVLSKDCKHLKAGLMKAKFGKSLKDFSQKFPFGDDAIRPITKFFEGEMDADKTLQSMMNALQNVEKLSNVFELDFAKARKLADWVRSAGGAHVSRIHEMRARLEDLVDVGQTLPDEVAMRCIAIRSMLDASNNRPAGSYFPAPYMPFHAERDMALRAPVLYSCFRSVVEAYIAMAVPNKARRKPLESDFADFFHAAHIPHVHAFRCDSKMYPFFTPVAEQFGTKLYRSLDDLVASIL